MIFGIMLFDVPYDYDMLICCPRLGSCPPVFFSGLNLKLIIIASTVLYDLFIHVNKSMYNLARFECALCKMRFKSKAALAIHRGRQHKEDKLIKVGN